MLSRIAAVLDAKGGHVINLYHSGAPVFLEYIHIISLLSTNTRSLCTHAASKLQMLAENLPILTSRCMWAQQLTSYIVFSEHS